MPRVILLRCTFWLIIWVPGLKLFEICNKCFPQVCQKVITISSTGSGQS